MEHMTPFLKLELPYSKENVTGTVEAIKDYFRK